MKTSDRQKMLNEILAGEEFETFRQLTVTSGVAAIRRRNRSRRLARYLAVLVPTFIAGAALWLFPGPKPPAHTTQVSPTAPGQHSETAAGVKTITDDELLALFPDRGVALIGKPGHQKLLVFGRQSL